MSSNLLCLNPSKTEFIIIGYTCSPAQIKKIPDPSIHLSNIKLFFTTLLSPLMSLFAILIGVTFDPHLSFSNYTYISNLSRSCFMHVHPRPPPHSTHA